MGGAIWGGDAGSSAVGACANAGAAGVAGFVRAGGSISDLPLCTIGSASFCAADTDRGEEVFKEELGPSVDVLSASSSFEGTRPGLPERKDIDAPSSPYPICASLIATDNLGIYSGD